MTDGHTAEEVVCALALRHRSSEYWAAENHCLTAKWSQIYCVFLSAELACSACSSAEVLWRYYNLVVCLFGSMNKPPSGNVVSVLTLQQETPRHNHVINIWLCCQKLAVSSLIPRPKSEWVSSTQLTWLWRKCVLLIHSALWAALSVRKHQQQWNSHLCCKTPAAPLEQISNWRSQRRPVGPVTSQLSVLWLRKTRWWKMFQLYF